MFVGIYTDMYYENMSGPAPVKLAYAKSSVLVTKYHLGLVQLLLGLGQP